MADGTDGVLVSRAGEERWEHDEETGGLVHLLRADDDVQAGLWSPGDRAGEPVEVELEANETVYVLAGSGTIEVDGGEPIELTAGTMLSLRKGARTRWVVDADFREFWVYA